MTVVVPHEIVWEILIWLPTKSLMRFKSVSKLWLSTILDPNFALEHRSPSRGLLAMNPDPHPFTVKSLPTRDFYFANFDVDANNDVVDFSFQFCLPKKLRSFRLSNITNGIICLYKGYEAKLFNIATREIINLPESRCDYYDYCTYHLGFEPVQSVFKLLKISHHICDANKRLPRIDCEILTLGVDLSWRSIQPPPHSIRPNGICIDGVLHLIIVLPSMFPSFPPYSFNVAEEKFQSVCHYARDISLQLPTFGTIPVLGKCRRLNPERLLIAVAHYREGSWTKFNNYTVDMDYDIGFDVRGSLPNGNLMIYSGELMIWSIDGVHTGCEMFLFDETKNSLRKYILKFPVSPSLRTYRHMDKLEGIFWLEENIVSLKTLTGFSKDLSFI